MTVSGEGDSHQAYIHSLRRVGENLHLLHGSDLLCPPSPLLPLPPQRKGDPMPLLSPSLSPAHLHSRSHSGSHLHFNPSESDYDEDDRVLHSTLSSPLHTPSGEYITTSINFSTKNLLLRLSPTSKNLQVQSLSTSLTPLSTVTPTKATSRTLSSPSTLLQRPKALHFRHIIDCQRRHRRRWPRRGTSWIRSSTVITHRVKAQKSWEKRRASPIWKTTWLTSRKSPMTRRNCEVVDFTRYHAKNNTELTNFMKMNRIQGYNGKYGSNPQGIKEFLDVIFKFDQIGREIDGRNWGKWYFKKVDFKSIPRNQKSSNLDLISQRNQISKWREISDRRNRDFSYISIKLTSKS